MKTLRTICREGPGSFLEFSDLDVYWSNGYFVIKNDHDLIKAINKMDKPLTKESKKYQQGFYFEKGSTSLNGLKTKLFKEKRAGLLKECLGIIKVDGVKLKGVKFPLESYFKERDLTIGLISEKGVLVGVNKDYHEYVSKRVAKGPDKIIAGNFISYVKMDSAYATIGIQEHFFNENFNNIFGVSNVIDFLKILYGDKFSEYLYDFSSIVEKYNVSWG